MYCSVCESFPLQLACQLMDKPHTANRWDFRLVFHHRRLTESHSPNKPAPLSTSSDLKATQLTEWDNCWHQSLLTDIHKQARQCCIFRINTMIILLHKNCVIIHSGIICLYLARCLNMSDAHIQTLYWWLGARLQYLHSLHTVIDMSATCTTQIGAQVFHP